MPIECVEITPQKEVYRPGDVLNVSVGFRPPFVGECELGLAPRNAGPSKPFKRTVFARSGSGLYEGQVHVRLDHIGPCVLMARLTQAGEEPTTVAAAETTIEVRPIRPL